MAIDPEQLAQEENEVVEEEDDLLDEQQRIRRRRRRRSRRRGIPWLRWIGRALVAVLGLPGRR